MSEPYIPIACIPDAIPADQREAHQQTAEQVFAAIQQVRELPNGYAFRFPAESDMLLNMARYIANERLCCPFFNFTLEVETGNGAIWLKLTGSAEAKQFIQTEMSDLITPA